MKLKTAAALACGALLLAGCAGGNTEDGMASEVSSAEFVSASSAETGGMERTSARSFLLSRDADGGLVFSACLFIDDVEYSLENIPLAESVASEVTEIVRKYDMLRRAGRELSASVFAQDAPDRSFELSYEGAVTVSLGDGYKKSDGFARGRSEIDALLLSLAERLAAGYRDSFFADCSGGWTSPDEGMGRYIGFSYDGRAASCRVGGRGEQWGRPAGSVDSFGASGEGVYTLGVSFPAEEADDMGRSWESMSAVYEIIPANGGGEMTVTDTADGAPRVYYRNPAASDQ